MKKRWAMAVWRWGCTAALLAVGIMIAVSFVWPISIVVRNPSLMGLPPQRPSAYLSDDDRAATDARWDQEMRAFRRRADADTLRWGAAEIYSGSLVVQWGREFNLLTDRLWSYQWPIEERRQTVSLFGASSHYTHVRLPLWVPVIVLAALTFVLWRAHLRAVRAGACRGCGYTLTGLAPGSPCPECGKRGGLSTDALKT